MRILIQRVREASVDIGGERHSAIGAGMLVLTGIEDNLKSVIGQLERSRQALDDGSSSRR